MDIELNSLIKAMNPWFSAKINPSLETGYASQSQTEELLLPDWDQFWLILTGPRQAGKTTLGKYLSYTLIQQGRFKNLLYINCDFLEI